MKFKIPSKVNVHGKKFKVKVIDTQEFAGMMDFEASMIYLSCNQNRRQLVFTFWHEYFHALHYRLGLHQALSREILEVLAEAQAQAVVEFLETMQMI